MERYITTLLVAGLLFPFLSLITGAVSLYHHVRHKRFVSPIFIPFVGPIAIDILLLFTNQPLWMLLIPWALDVGTLAFLRVTPRLICEWWQTSTFTRLKILRGSQGKECVELSLHSGGYYYLSKTWMRMPHELGIISLGEVGRYSLNGSDVQLDSSHGFQRTLRLGQPDVYCVDEVPNIPADYSLQDWTLNHSAATDVK